MTDTVDAIVIGAGVVGLAIGRALAIAGREVVVLEQHGAIGEETSARNSEVIHAGIYYPAGSLKARLCVTGAAELYRYCEAKGVPHRRCGKVIVAVEPQQIETLAALRARGTGNGAAALEWLSQGELAALEPGVRGAAAVWSPATGIIDSHALMLALRGDLEHHGGAIALETRFTGAERGAGTTAVTCEAGGEPYTVNAGIVVNAAGLHASRVAAAMRGFAPRAVPRTRYAKGSYFVYSGKSPFSHLVYPLPEPGGLGVHATLDLAGRARFGPDVEWVEHLDYAVDPARAERFYASIRSYWPGLPDGGLTPGYAGIRPKITAPGEPAGDFVIRAVEEDGATLVELFGIESPGLTSCLAIADHVLELLGTAP